MKNKILEIIKDESEKAGIRKYTCINGFGYSQFERNIAERVVKLFAMPDVSNNEVAACDHSHGFYFDEKGIITCVRCHPPKEKAS